MFNFYSITALVALVSLIVILVVVALLMKKNTDSTDSKIVFPPTANKCPNSWIYDENKKICMFDKINVGNLPKTSKSDPGPKMHITYDSTGKVTSRGISMEDPYFTKGGTTLCSQKKWANDNNIIWDGVSNVSSC